MKSDIANHLLNIDAVKLNTKNLFTWTSGIKSPIYCDNRVINSDIIVRNAVINEFIQLLVYQPVEYHMAF